MPTDALDAYRRKRDPQKTPEPFGTAPTGGATTSGGIFVVQQHAARRMHWDLRLEINGALASWAVPRGPILDPRSSILDSSSTHTASAASKVQPPTNTPNRRNSVCSASFNKS